MNFKAKTITTFIKFFILKSIFFICLIGFVIYQCGCFSSSNGYANNLNIQKDENILFTDIKKTRSLFFIDQSGYLIFHEGNCLEGCIAKKIAEKKVRIERFEGTEAGKWGGNPADLTCMKAGGSPIVLYTKKNDEVSACMWKDKSVSLSWDLVKISKQ